MAALGTLPGHEGSREELLMGKPIPVPHCL